MSQVSIASYLDPCAQFIAIQTKGRAKRRRPRTRRRDRLRNVSRGARCPPGALVACPPGAPAAFHCPSPRPYVPQVHKTWGHETPDARRRLTSPGGSCALRVSSTSRLSLPASAPGRRSRRARSSCRAVPFRRRDGPEDECQPQLSARAPLCGCDECQLQADRRAALWDIGAGSALRPGPRQARGRCGARTSRRALCIVLVAGVFRQGLCYGHYRV